MSSEPTFRYFCCWFSIDGNDVEIFFLRKSPLETFKNILVSNLAAFMYKSIAVKNKHV